MDSCWFVHWFQLDEVNSLIKHVYFHVLPLNSLLFVGFILMFHDTISCIHDRKVHLFSPWLDMVFLGSLKEQHVIFKTRLLSILGVDVDFTLYLYLYIITESAIGFSLQD